MSKFAARLVLAVVLPLTTIAIGFGSYLITRSDLPDRVAVHFDGNGNPDRSVGHTRLLIEFGIMIALGCAALVASAVWARRIKNLIGPMLAVLGGFIAGLGSGALSQTVWSQRNIDSWQVAPGPGWEIVWILALPMVAGGIAAWCVTEIAPPRFADEVDSSMRPTMELAPGENAIWTSSVRSNPLLVLGVVLLLAGITLAFFSFGLFAIAPIISGSAVLTLATLRVRVDRAGLHIKYGVLHWPTTNIPVERIRAASVIDVRPMKWGGWGYRGSLKLMKQAAVVLRAGPGIRLDLTDGKVFVVTVDDPESPVALLNAEVARQPVA